MTSTCSVAVLLGLVIVVTGSLEVPKIKLLKQQTHALSEQNPSNGPHCFSLYKPQLDSIATHYEIEYETCNNAFAEQTALEDSKWRTTRYQLVEDGTNTCRAMTDCSSIVGYVEAFECYAQMVRDPEIYNSYDIMITNCELKFLLQGAEQSKSMYTLSANALEDATEMKAYYQVIENTKTVCINNAERTYVESTTNAYEQLNSCLSSPNTPRSTTWPTTNSTPKRTPTTTPRTTTKHTTFNTADWFSTSTTMRTPTTTKSTTINTSTTTMRTPTTTPRTTFNTADWFTTPTTTRHPFTTTTARRPPPPPNARSS